MRRLWREGEKMKKLITEKTLFGKKIVGITNGNITLKECPNDEADKVIIQKHYSRKATKNRFKSFSVNGEKGYLQLGYGIRPHMKHTISNLITHNNYCEFDRMWLSDELPKNSESQVIGLLLSYLKQIYPRIKFIITYADGSVGNKGIIYQATNAIALDNLPCDFYVLAGGERVHPISMYHRHGTRARAFLEKFYPGIQHINGMVFQYRYLYILNRCLRKKFQERNAVNQTEGSGRSRPSAPNSP